MGKMGNSIQQLSRANRLLSMLSRINRTIVRADSPDRLYEDTCATVIASELFQYVWIGLLDPNTGRFRRMSHCGEAPDQQTTLEALDAAANLVLQKKGALVCNDLDALAHGAPCHAAMRAHGLRSMAGMPLWEAQELVGVLLLYCARTDVFDQEVSDLLAEVAGDISFSLEHMRAEQQRVATEARLHYLAYYDAQTGLPNRATLDERLPELAALVDQERRWLTLVNVKLRRVEQIVQVLGKAAMDDVLRVVAARLERCRGVEGLVAQLSHDEFAIVTYAPTESAAIGAFAQHVRGALLQAVKSGGRDVFLQLGIGIAVYPLHDSAVDNLLRRARAATECSSNAEAYRIYSADLDQGLEQRVQIQSDLHRAMEREEFVLHFQPQLNLRTGNVVGVEALIRWQHPIHGLIPPSHFIPMLEEAGLMPQVGAWVLQAACLQAKAWQRAGLVPMRMAVNLSAQQFRSADLVAIVKNALNDAQLDAEFLELELTESMILESAEQTISMMHELKALGVTFSLDDFGTGYSSLSYLSRYPVDRIKIDQSFVRDMTQTPGSAALVRSILAMALNLGLKTIAEGVETVGQHGYLRRQPCQEMQGYLFSRALPAADLEHLLRSGGRYTCDEAASNAGNTLLIVDDEPHVLTALKRVFRKDGWIVLTASGAEQAYELLATHEVGVIVSDQRMPGITGTEFLQVAKELYPDTIRMLLTGYADFETVIDAVNRGDLFKVLSKPIDDTALRSSIQQAFRQFDVFAENHRLMQRVEALERLGTVSDDSSDGART